MPNNYKIEWSYKDSNGKRRTESDVFFCELSARDAVKKVYADYSDYPDLRIEGMWRECSDCWDCVSPFLWEDID